MRPTLNKNQWERYASLRRQLEGDKFDLDAFFKTNITPFRYQEAIRHYLEDEVKEKILARAIYPLQQVRDAMYDIEEFTPSVKEVWKALNLLEDRIHELYTKQKRKGGL